MTSTASASGRQALDALRGAAGDGRPYDLAILDMQMPEMDGLDAGARDRGRRRVADAQLVLLTSIELARIGRRGARGPASAPV